MAMPSVGALTHVPEYEIKVTIRAGRLPDNENGNLTTFA